MAFSALAVQAPMVCSFQVSNNVVGFNAQPINDQFRKSFSFGLGAGAGQCNRLYAAVTTLAASASTTLDLTALTDVFGTSLNFARVKYMLIVLLALTDILEDASTGTICTGITVGNAAATQFGGSGYPIGDTVTSTQTLTNGEGREFIAPGATGWLVSGSIKSLKILNNDGTNSAKVMLIMAGADV